ncbi:MAG: non-canonical purine NTP pyrophosphatase [SAR324 cluster bacterium]|nr:non-canonical purine NTP pyrophosphatase [SAR324 cluster bacterium]
MECNLSRIELDLLEIQTTDLHELVKFKLRQAYEHVQAPVIVEDTSLYFEAWNELPGPLVKFFLKNIGLSGMVRALDEFCDNSASAACCLGFTKDGKSMHLFEGKVKGNIVEPRGSQQFGWDAVFLPAGYQRTFGEMSSQEKHQISPRGMAAKKIKGFLTLQARQK